MRKLLLLLFLCAMSILGRAQAGYILYVNSAPSGTCSQGSYERVVIGAGTVYTCQSGTWTQVGAGSGSVTSIATTAPITGGTITGSGTIACASCVKSTSPGVGLAHFAGSTQEATSSAVNLAGADVTGTLAVGNGGTGATTLTAHGVVVGNTASAVNVTSAGTSGYVLTSNGASADPTFQAASATTAAMVGVYCTNSGGGANTISCSTDFNVKANTLIVAFCGSGQSGGLAFADSGPGGGSALTWTAIATATNNTGATLSEKAWWANPGSATGSDTFTCTLTNTSSFNGLAVYAVAGVSLTSPVDASGTLITNGTLVMQLAATNTNDIVLFGMENSGTAVQPVGFSLPLNDTSIANSSGWAINGPYNFRIGTGTHGAVVAVALH